MPFFPRTSFWKPQPVIEAQLSDMPAAPRPNAPAWMPHDTFQVTIRGGKLITTPTNPQSGAKLDPTRKRILVDDTRHNRAEAERCIKKLEALREDAFKHGVMFGVVGASAGALGGYGIGSYTQLFKPMTGMYGGAVLGLLTTLGLNYRSSKQNEATAESLRDLLTLIDSLNITAAADPAQFVATLVDFEMRSNNLPDSTKRAFNELVGMVNTAAFTHEFWRNIVISFQDTLQRRRANNN